MTQPEILLCKALAVVGVVAFLCVVAFLLLALLGGG